MYLSLYLKGFVCERELETEQNYNILTLTLMAISVSFPLSRAAQMEAHSAGSGLSLPHLVTNRSGLQTNWLPVFTELCNSSIAHSISLEWHVWSSSSGNNCHAVHRSLSSGASVYDCTMGFYLVPYCQPSPPTWFLPITAIGMCPFRCITLEWHVWPGRRSIYNSRKWISISELKSWMRLFAFPIALTLLRKVGIRLFSLKLWAKNRAVWTL